MLGRQTPLDRTLYALLLLLQHVDRSCEPLWTVWNIRTLRADRLRVLPDLYRLRRGNRLGRRVAWIRLERPLQTGVARLCEPAHATALDRLVIPFTRHLDAERPRSTLLHADVRECFARR